MQPERYRREVGGKEQGKSFRLHHVQIDAGGKFIRNYAVTDASIHDSQVFELLLDERNSNREVFADSAYR